MREHGEDGGDKKTKTRKEIRNGIVVEVDISFLLVDGDVTKV